MNAGIIGVLWILWGIYTLIVAHRWATYPMVVIAIGARPQFAWWYGITMLWILANLVIFCKE